jgi:hypothetical protein
VHLRLEPGPQRDQLCSISHQLAQLPRRWRGDPRLGQPVHPQQIRQITGITHVVLHPPVPESLDTQWMREVHRGPGRLQGVDRPVPAIGCLEHHLRMFSGLLDLQSQRDRVVDDPHRGQLLTGVGLSDDHRPLPVQIDPDDLVSVILVHRGHLLLRRVEVDTPSIRREPRGAGGPAPSSHQDRRIVGAGFGAGDQGAVAAPGAADHPGVRSADGGGDRPSPAGGAADIGHGLSRLRAVDQRGDWAGGFIWPGGACFPKNP